MSRLTNCCACGCTPEQLFWVTPGPNAIASVPEGTLPTGPTGCVEVASFTYGTQDFHRLTGECQSLAVTTETDRDTVVLDILAEPPPVVFGTFVPNVKAFDISLKLWCNGEGQQEIGTVRLWAELGSRLLDTKFTQDPESFALAVPSFGEFVVYNTCWFKVFASLTVAGQTETVQIICPTTELQYGGGLNTTYLEESTFGPIWMRVTATCADGKCDVHLGYSKGGLSGYANSGISDGVGYSELSIGEIQPTFVVEDVHALGVVPVGLGAYSPARRHLFPPVNAIRQHRRFGATIERDNDWLWAIRIRAKSYSPLNAPAVPAVPEQSENQCVCTPTGATGPAECFVARTESETAKPENPYQYPWFLSPCSHVRRGSRVTHGRPSSQFDNLSVTLPSYGSAPYAWGSYLSQLPSGPYELNAARSGVALADDTFWLAAGSVPVITGENGYLGSSLGVRTDSMTIGASIRTIVVRTGSYGGTVQFPWTVLVPCPGDQDEWITHVMVFVYLRGRFANGYAGGAFPSDANSSPFAIWITHFQAVGSGFFRGEETSSTNTVAIGVPVQANGCRAQFFGVNPDPVTVTTLFSLTYGTPFKVQLV